MRVLAIDVESTGLDPQKDRVIEYGWVLWDTDRAAPLSLGGSLVRRGSPDEPTVPTQITKLTGITDDDREEFGDFSAAILNRIAHEMSVHGAERLVAHNAQFDRAFIDAELGRLIGFDPSAFRRPWIDTMVDLPTEAESRGLLALCAEHGFVLPMRHRAVFDALACCLLLQRYPLAEVVRRADAPVVTLQALVSFDEKDLAKARRFTWDGPRKRWIRTVKDFEVETVTKDAPFRVLKVAA